MMKLIFLNQTKNKNISSKQMAQALKMIERRLQKVRLKAFARKRLCSGTLTLIFVGSQRQKKLNQNYRLKSYVADILSFAPVEAASLGELSICLSRIKKDARVNRVSFSDQLLYIFIHGILHLLGYDHEINDKSAQQMYDLQDQIFAELRDKWP